MRISQRKILVCSSGEWQFVYDNRVVVFVFREEPEADGNLRAGEKLAGEGVHEVRRMMDE